MGTYRLALSEKAKHDLKSIKKAGKKSDIYKKKSKNIQSFILSC